MEQKFKIFLLIRSSMTLFEIKGHKHTQKAGSSFLQNHSQVTMNDAKCLPHYLQSMV